jgi:hypothetical protein
VWHRETFHMVGVQDVYRVWFWLMLLLLVGRKNK